MEQREERPRELSSRGRQTKGGTPIIDRFGRDLTQLASEGKLDFVIGREYICSESNPLTPCPINTTKSSRR